ncbi:MAG TPA: DUF507 family protein [Nitrospirota bacterium]|jgi:hypothetical protein|nr:DUF507 family protein [Nitrospirota bacterium]
MRLSEDRVSHLSHLILDKLVQDRTVGVLHPEEKLLREIKRTISDELKFEDDADDAARRTIRSLSRKVPEGSREWDVLYRKYFEEEMNRRRKV